MSYDKINYLNGWRRKRFYTTQIQRFFTVMAMYNPRGSGPGSHPFGEVLDSLRIEYDKLAKESNRYKLQRDEYERKCLYRFGFQY